MRKTFYPLFVALWIASGIGQAGVVYDVSLTTSPLIGHPAGPFALEFQLTDGAGIGDANNTAVLSNFIFNGGAAVGSPVLTGGVSGNLGSSIAMTDSSFFSQFIQNFSPSATFSFRLNLSTNIDDGGVPDEFSLSIPDRSGFEIPTHGAANALLLIDIGSSTPAGSTSATDIGQSPNAGGPPIDIAAPQVSPAVSAVPEPGSLCLLIIPLLVRALAPNRRAWPHPRS
jgi:hypothetical protein